MTGQNVSFCPMLHRNITRKPLKTHGPETANMGQNKRSMPYSLNLRRRQVDFHLHPKRLHRTGQSVQGQCVILRV